MPCLSSPHPDCLGFRTQLTPDIMAPSENEGVIECRLTEDSMVTHPARVGSHADRLVAKKPRVSDQTIFLRQPFGTLSTRPT